MQYTNKKVHQKLKSAKKSPLKVLLLILVTAFVALSLLQAERLARKGTFFGYKVREVSSKSEKSKKSSTMSGSLTSTANLPDGSNSEACKVITLDEVKRARPVDFKQSGGLTPDKKDPLTSTCIYSYKGEGSQSEMISVLIRDKKDSSEAGKVLSSLKTKGSGEDIKGVGDEAYFNKSANQLTVRKNNRVITITVSGGNNSKDVSQKIAKSAL